MLICMLATAASAYEYDANDFATEVIEYIEGDMRQLDWVDRPIHRLIIRPTHLAGRR